MKVTHIVLVINHSEAVDTISYPLFADMDMGIYSRTTLQYHVWLKAKNGIAMLSMEKFPYPQKQSRGNEFISWTNNHSHILKCFHSFKTQLSLLSGSSYKQSVTRSLHSSKEKWTAVVIAISTSSVTFLSLCISRWWCQTWDTCLYLMVVSQSEARVSTEHEINFNIITNFWQELSKLHQYLYKNWDPTFFQAFHNIPLPGFISLWMHHNCFLEYNMTLCSNKLMPMCLSWLNNGGKWEEQRHYIAE